MGSSEGSTWRGWLPPRVASKDPLVFTSTNKVYDDIEDIALNSEGAIYYLMI